MPAATFILHRPDQALAMRGLRVLVGGPETAPGVPQSAAGSALWGGGRVNLTTLGEIQQKVEGFLAYAQTIRLDITRQVLAFDSAGRQARSGTSGGVGLVGGIDAAQSPIAGMCLWVPSPGKTAMLFAPALSEYPNAARATELAISAALQDARAAGVVLVQAMLEPADAAGKTVFAAAGLNQLATLTYMERKPPHVPPVFELPGDLALLPYEPRTHALFHRAIADSYTGTLDCPAMSGMRAVDDVIEGHKSVGIFDPQLWGVLVQKQPGAGDAQGRPIGCLLLAEIPARRGLELVYLGLSPLVRGRGLARLLMQRALAVASRRQMSVATLAVDAANTPAVRLYRRCGYTSVAQRVGLIKRLV